MRCRAFTLIELLVVLAVVALLAAGLMPVLLSARERGRQTTCLNNLHQIGVLLQQYVQDNDGHYPGATYFYASGTDFSLLGTRGLPAQVCDRQILWCPSNVRPVSGAVAVAVPETASVLFTNYVYNSGVTQERSGRGRTGRSESEVPTTTWLLVWDGSHRPGQGVTRDRAGCSERVSGLLYPTLHHGGGDYLFVDGHAAWLRPEAALTLQCQMTASPDAHGEQQVF